MTPSDPVGTPSDGVTEPTSPTPSPRPSLWGRGRDGVDGPPAKEQNQPTPSDGVGTNSRGEPMTPTPDKWLPDTVNCRRHPPPQPDR
jgi:hypothetical protein